ncbi:serpin B12-like [Rhea pennata]|uniref:serpin B12-like n=1 Tax=Rhea pennata TaxID=8795 RepID=UPI002E273BA2
MASISRSITEFCLGLYKECNKNAEGTNIIFSPMSISIALALVELGAKHNSAAQIEKVLHLRKATERVSLGSMPESTAPATEVEQSLERQPHFSRCSTDGETHHEEFHALLLQLQNLDKRYILSLANNLFVQQEFEFQQQYLMCTKELYGTILQTVDFQNALEATREKINSWVESETQGKIKELFAPGVIDSRAVLVLVNVIYFKASWEHKFEEKNTVERDFRLNQNESKPVQMMYQKGKFKLGYIEEIGVQIIELPYVQKSLSMIILLPDDIADGSTNGLEQIERAMTYEKLVLWASSEYMHEGTVEVYLPRFKLEGSFDLNLFLQAMGMTDVFLESKADLSAMSFAKGLFLSKVVHKTYIEVNEEGTVAAGATGAVIVRRSLPFTEVFMANHPFLFFIRHNPTNTILFFGKLCSP